MLLTFVRYVTNLITFSPRLDLAPGPALPQEPALSPGIDADRRHEAHRSRCLRSPAAGGLRSRLPCPENHEFGVRIRFFVRVVARDDPTSRLAIRVEAIPLRSKRKPLAGLLFGGYANVQGYPEGGALDADAIRDNEIHSGLSHGIAPEG